MARQKQNPGLAPRASSIQLQSRMPSFVTTTDMQVQRLACRQYLSPSMARIVAPHCYGEGQS